MFADLERIPGRWAWRYAPTVPPHTLLGHHRLCRWVCILTLTAWALIGSVGVETLLFRAESNLRWAVLRIAIWFAIGGVVPALAAGFWAGEIERELSVRGAAMESMLRIKRVVYRRVLRVYFWMALLYALALTLRGRPLL